MLEEATRLQRESEAALGKRLPDAAKIEMLRRAYVTRLGERPQQEDLVTLGSLADVLGRTDEEALALAEEFKSIDLNGDVWLQVAEFWLRLTGGPDAVE